MLSQNFKYGDIRLEPRFSLKCSANFLVSQSLASSYKKQWQNAQNITKRDLWHEGNFHSTKHAVRLLKSQIEAAHNYVYVRMTFNTWYVKRL